MKKEEYMPGVNRINTYTDSRFSKKVLNQHGAFLIGDEPYEVEIVSKTDAIIRGKNPNFYESVIENFRFYAEHITNFWDESNNLVKTYPAVELVRISIAEIQPSQFYVDEIKKRAVSDFVYTEEDLVIPLVKWEGRNVSVDGHTRLFVAAEKGIQNVYGFYTKADDYVRDFAAEAIRRNIVSPYQLVEVKHRDYEKLWFAFCDEYFSGK